MLDFSPELDTVTQKPNFSVTVSSFAWGMGPRSPGTGEPSGGDRPHLLFTRL
ncbi:hypothetical protein [Laspinema palackyanum]|uniref:hypothetical protein n=1 Tax=Laspinema palackyanum TaxID=3231601 RepID=UPI00345CC4E9|nr:hypothetical protein [Laspinema sp. D2c]